MCGTVLNRSDLDQIHEMSSGPSPFARSLGLQERGRRVTMRALLLLTCCGLAAALDNGLGQTPVRGWNRWDMRCLTPWLHTPDWL